MSISMSMLSVGAVMAMLTLVFTQLIANKFRSKIRSQTKKVRIFSLNSMLYVLMFVGILTIPVLITLLTPDITWTYIFVAIYALLVGILHCSTFYKLVKWAEKAVDIMPDLLFAMILTILGTVTFLAALSFLPGNQILEPSSYYFVLLPFMLPMFILKTVFLLGKVPELDYPRYKISAGDKRVSPEERRNARPIDVKLMFPMSSQNETLTPIPCKLLSDIEFGINAFQLVRRHNGKPELQNIDIYDTQGNEYEYLFYRKPKWMGVKRFIDPNINIVKNRISARDVIIVQRHPAGDIKT